MSDTFKVRVFKAGSKAYWYADKIGEEFSVTVDSDIDFLTITAGSKTGGYIDKSDCVIVEDEMETYKGYRQLKDITVKALILAGAEDIGFFTSRDYWHFLYGHTTGMYGITVNIPLNEAIDYASSCPEKLQWLVDQGFVEEVEEELKPCPFCGGEPGWWWAPDKQGWIRCPDCGISNKLYNNKQEATSHWNKRV